LCCNDYDIRSAAVRIQALCNQIVEQQGMPPIVMLHVRSIETIAAEMLAAGHRGYETKGAGSG
jgi:DNA-binding NarL/FixJ family response regulator